MNTLSKAEYKLLKKAKSKELTTFVGDEITLCKLLCKKGYLHDSYKKESDVSYAISYHITNNGIIYIESQNKETIQFVVSKIIIPFLFFLLGVISSNFDKILNLIFKIIHKN